MIMRLFTSIFLIALSAGNGVCEPATSVPATAIASGSSVLVDSDSDPSFALINVRVDIGTLRQVGDAIEAELTWKLKLGLLKDTRAEYPGVNIPDGSAAVTKDRIVCRVDGALYYAVETRIVAPDGTLVTRRTYDAELERKKAEELQVRWGRVYSRDPRSLVCWAAARKCEEKDFTWPPPPNNTPLEDSERATKMQKDYYSQFVPRCRVPESR